MKKYTKELSVIMGSVLTVLAVNTLSTASLFLFLYQPKAPKSLLNK